MYLCSGRLRLPPTDRASRRERERERERTGWVIVTCPYVIGFLNDVRSTFVDGRLCTRGSLARWLAFIALDWLPPFSALSAPHVINRSQRTVGGWVAGPVLPYCLSALNAEHKELYCRTATYNLGNTTHS